jgi:hypothetical protein
MPLSTLQPTNRTQARRRRFGPSAGTFGDLGLLIRPTTVGQQRGLRLCLWFHSEPLAALTAEGADSAIKAGQIAGVFAQLEKARLVGKLKAAHDRKRATGAKVEGRKSYAELDARDYGGGLIATARKLRRKPPKDRRPSLRAVSAKLAAAGFVSTSGKPFGATAVARMLGEL